MIAQLSLPVSIRSHSFTSGSTKEEICKSFSSHLPEPTTTTVDGFVGIISDETVAWSPHIGQWTDAREIITHMFVLDFDGQPWDGTVSHIKELQLPQPSILYRTQSDSGGDVPDYYRLIWLIDRQVRLSKKQYQTIYRQYAKALAGDKQCSNINRIWLPGPSGIEEDISTRKTLDPSFMLYSLDNVDISDRHKRRIKTGLQKSIRKMSGSGTRSIINTCIDPDPKADIFRPLRREGAPSLSEAVRRTCSLARRLMDGEEISGDHLAQLALHGQLGRIRGSEGLSIAISHTWPESKIIDARAWVGDDGMPRLICHESCPMKNTCTAGCDSYGNKSLYLSIRNISKQRWQRTKNDDCIDITDARARTHQAVRCAIESTDRDIHIVNAPTGAGKSHALASYLAGNPVPCVVAFPTHKAKDEFYKMYRSMGGEDAVVLPDRPKSSDRELESQIQRHLSLGNIVTAHKLISQIPGGKEYLTARRQTYACPVYTTHAHALNYETDYPIIFDEDPFDAVLEQAVVSRDDVYAYYMYLNGKGERFFKIAKHYKQFLVNDGNYNNTDKSVSDKDLMLAWRQYCLGENISCKLLPLGQSTVYRAAEKISYVVKHDLPLYRPVVILSATANADIYRKLTNKTVHAETIPPISVGDNNIYQCADKSWAKSSKYNSDKISRLIPTHSTPDICVIRHKSSDVSGPSMIPVHGNSSATNNYQNCRALIVHSKLVYPEEAIRILAKAIDPDADVSCSRVKQRIRVGPWQGKLFTYTDPTMQMLDIHIQSSNNIQAVGRARIFQGAGRTVLILTDIPHPQATMVAEGNAENTLQEIQSVNDGSQIIAATA